ncbi:hypothetical protein RhiJN_10317 [Ceratobasidium sp. AG-Ba]|nr:hypothetical protein RhiJN_10317 [Ceratobasidium sp. AG-Ba]
MANNRRPPRPTSTLQQPATWLAHPESFVNQFVSPFAHDPVYNRSDDDNMPQADLPRVATNFAFVNRGTFTMVELRADDGRERWGPVDLIAHISPLLTKEHLAIPALSGWAPLPSHLCTGKRQMETVYARVPVRWPLDHATGTVRFPEWTVNLHAASIRDPARGIKYMLQEPDVNYKSIWDRTIENWESVGQGGVRVRLRRFSPFPLNVPHPPWMEKWLVHQLRAHQKIPVAIQGDGEPSGGQFGRTWEWHRKGEGSTDGSEDEADTQGD